MISYSKQLNNTDCGPCALGNALKFLERGSYRESVKWCRAILGWQPHGGVPNSQMHAALKFLSKRLGFEVIKFKNPTWKKMQQMATNGYGLVVSYDFIPNDFTTGHFIFMSMNGSTMWAWNDSVDDMYHGKLKHMPTNGDIWKKRLARGDIYMWAVRNI